MNTTVADRAIREDDGEDKQHEQVGERQHRIDDPHQHVVDPAAVVAGDGSKRDADANCDHHRREADQERHLSAKEHPRKQIAAQLVRAQRVRP